MNAPDKYPLLIGHSVKGSKRLHNISQVADFICQDGLYGNITITQEDGTPFLNTFGIYIDKIADTDYHEELLEVLSLCRWKSTVLLIWRQMKTKF